MLELDLLAGPARSGQHRGRQYGRNGGGQAVVDLRIVVLGFVGVDGTPPGACSTASS